MAVLTRDEADYIFGLPKRPSVDTIQWQVGDGGFLNLTVPIKCDDGTVLELRGWYNPRTGKYGLSLLHAGVYPIRRWDKKRGHRDPLTKQTIEGPHKHYHHEDYGDACAYPTDDVEPQDVNRGLRDFLNECNVDMGSTVIQPLLVQGV